MFRRHRTTIAALLGLMALHGCFSFKIESDYDRAANFQGLRTYGWRPRTEFPTGDPRFYNPLIDSRVRAAADRVLMAKGYTKSVAPNPDFLVGYHAVVRSRTDVATIDRWYGYRTGGFAQPHLDVRSYEEGTLLIDVIEPGTMKLLWRGAATGVVREMANAEERGQRADEAGAAILEKFPPTP